MPLFLCVLGCGDYAATFARQLRRLPDSPVRLYFASRDLRRAQAYCRRYGGQGAFGSYEEAVADPRIDACYICTPHHLHLEHTLLAISHGKHVLVEKPITRTPEEARYMIGAASKAGVKLMVAENARFLPVVRHCRQLIGEGALGELRLAQFQQEGPFKPGGWRSSAEKMGGGLLIDGGIHLVDLMVHLAGCPLELSAVRMPHAMEGMEGEDGVTVTARLHGGAFAFINYSWAATPRIPRGLVSLSGTRGKISFRPGGQTITLETTTGRRQWRFPEDRLGISAMVHEFRDAIIEERTPAMSAEEGLYDLELVLAAYRSAETNKSVPTRRTVDI